MAIYGSTLVIARKHWCSDQTERLPIETMKAQLRVSYAIGATLTIVGSFLPWWCEGDIGWFCTRGISVYPWIDNWFRDSGGLLIVLLSAAMMGMAFRASHAAKRLAIWTMTWGAILVLDSIYHIGSWVIRRIEADGMSGTPALRVGLAMVFFGSLVLLSTAWFHYQDSKLAMPTSPPPPNRLAGGG
jgi:hypothetical protein